MPPDAANDKASFAGVPWVGSVALPGQLGQEGSGIGDRRNTGAFARRFGRSGSVGSGSSWTRRGLTTIPIGDSQE